MKAKDLKPGMFVTLVALTNHGACGVEPHPGKGRAMLIRSVLPPYIVIQWARESPDDKIDARSFDTRTHHFMEVTDDYAKALLGENWRDKFNEAPPAPPSPPCEYLGGDWPSCCRCDHLARCPLIDSICPRHQPVEPVELVLEDLKLGMKVLVWKRSDTQWTRPPVVVHTVVSLDAWTQTAKCIWGADFTRTEYPANLYRFFRPEAAS